MANQTIIQAAGQRYAPIKTDYSGYIQGLGSIATALVEKTKATQKNKAANDKLLASSQSDIIPYVDFLKEFRDREDVSEETKGIVLEKMVKQTTRLNEQRAKIHKMLKEDGGLSKSIDPAIRNWILAYANGDFDKDFTITRDIVETIDGQEYPKTEEHTFNMAFRLGDNMMPEVIGPEGEYITMDDLENLLNTANKTDGDGVLNEILDFSKRVADPDLETPKFNTFRDMALTNIKNLINDGDKDISSENIMNSFMFDKTFILDGKETGFLDWYLDDEDLMPEDFKQQFITYRETYQIGGEIEEEMMGIIAQDLIKNDPNIKEDLMKFITQTLESYR